MKETKKWIIVDSKKNKALHGIESKTMVFSTEEVAGEVASQLFESSESYLLIEINT